MNDLEIKKRLNREKQRLNLQRWRENNREYSNKLQLYHSKKYQRWQTISKGFLKNYSDDFFL